MKKAFFITFEGIDGSGKTTQAKRLYLRLKKQGIPVILTSEPGGTSVGSHIRKILLSENSISSLSELFLYAADRAQHIKEVIEPLLKSGFWIISDRFSDATVAYQGYGRGIDLEFINMINKRICGYIKPDITFLLDCRPEIALRRLKRKDRFEREDLSFHYRVRDGYLSIAKKDRERIIVIDAERDVEKIEEEIFFKVRNISGI